MKLADVDLEVISTNAGRSSKRNPANYLVRHNIMEVFTRMASTKYVKNGDSANYSEAMDKLLGDYLIPYMEKFDTHKWRTKNLWTLELDLAFKHGLEPLKKVYKEYIGKFALPGAPRYMSLQEFQELINTADIYTENFGSLLVPVQYNLAMMTRVDEVEDDKHLNMTFTEFIEAIARVAENLEIPHPIEDTKEPDEDWSPGDREVFAQRPLNQKVEAFLLTLT